MTHLTPLTTQHPVRFGAALLLAAAATGSGGFAQSPHSKPTTVLASISKPGSPPHAALSTLTKQHGASHALAAAVKPHGNVHALAAAVKPHGAPRTLAAVAKPPSSAHLLASASRPASAVHALATVPVRPGAARELLSVATRPELPVHAFVPTTHAPAHALAAAATGGGDSAAFSFTGTTDAEHALHLTVGHVMFLNTKERVRRIYIANPAVLDSYTISPNQVVVTAKGPGISSLVVWDQNDQSQVYMISSDINVDALSASMKQAMPTDNIKVEGREARVVLTGSVSTDASFEAAAKLATLFSKDVANSLIVNTSKVKQVQLKVRIVEVDRSKAQQFGINIFNPGGNTTIGAGTTSQFPTTATLAVGGSGTGGTLGTVGGGTLTVSDPLNFLFYSSKLNVGVTVKDLENKQVLQILAEPTITTISGQKASFLAGGEFPFPVVQGSAGGAATVTVQFRPYGVKLEFTPVVNVDGSVALKVAPEVSALDFTNAVTISGYTIPALATKRADTQVVLRSGQSFAISGLLDHRTTDAFSRTPGIASVPILGLLFKSKNINLSTSELIVIVTPTIVDPLSDAVETKEPAPVAPFMKDERFDKSLPPSAFKP